LYSSDGDEFCKCTADQSCGKRLPHKIVEIATSASVYEHWVTKEECTRCGWNKEYTDVHPGGDVGVLRSHEWEYTDGNGTCSVCKYECINNDKHDKYKFNEAINTNDATRHKVSYKCPYCNGEIYGSEKHLFNTYDYKPYDDTYHYLLQRCVGSDSGEAMLEDRSGCGYEVKKKAEHDYGDWITSTEATCASTGTKYRTCWDCGYT
jgi:hypothetical protein